MSARDYAPLCSVCNAPIHPHRSSGTGWQHYPITGVWCDGPPPPPDKETG